MRNLTNKEIRDILSSLKVQRGLPKPIQEKMYHNLITPLIEPLQKIKIKSEKIPDLKKEILRQYYSSLVQPGENIGVIAAQSISEKNTQITLDTFHTLNTGIQTVLTGIPRFKVLCDTTMNPKVVSCKVQLLEPDEQLIFTAVYLKDLVISHDLIKYPERNFDEDFSIFYPREEKEDYCIRFFIDLKIQYKYRITFERIRDVLSNYSLVFGPLGTDYFDIVLESPPMFESDYTQTVLDYRLCGIDGITNIYRKNSTTIITEGSNFVELLGHPNVDANETVSNHLWEIYNALGIEAARQFLLNEFTLVTSEGGYLNQKHLQVLVNFMVSSGTVTPITRQTMKNNESSVLSKISFEQPIDNLTIAAFHNSVDKLNEACANIICGRAIQTGTGMPDILIDQTKL